MVIAKVHLAAAIVTGHPALKFPNPLETRLTRWTIITPSPFQGPGRKRKLVSRPLAGNPKISARPLPLHPMSLNPPIPISFISHKMGQLVQHRHAHFFPGNFNEPWVQLDERHRPGRTTGTRPHPTIPTNAHPGPQIRQPQTFQKRGAPRRALEIKTPQFRSRQGRDSLQSRSFKETELHLTGGSKHEHDYHGFVNYFKNGTIDFSFPPVKRFALPDFDLTVNVTPCLSSTCSRSFC